MRTALLLSSFVFALSSCKPETVTERETIWCTLKCQNPQIKVQLPFSGDTTKGMILIAFGNDGTLHDTIGVTNPATVMLNTGIDYQLILPKINKSYLFTYIDTYPSERSGKCGDVCANAVPTMQVKYDWQPHSFSLVLTDKLEYTLYL